MTTIELTSATIQDREPAHPIDDAELAAAAFPARYSGRTLEAYRHDLRGIFQWASNNGLVVLEATRPHIELFRASMEDRGQPPGVESR